MTESDPIQGVLFALGGVVIASPLHVIAPYEQDLGIPAGFINRLVVETGPEGAWSRMERGEIRMEQFHRDFEAECSAGGHPISAATMMARIGECQPRPAMLQAIRRLKEAGLRVGALTNNWVTEDEAAKPHEFAPLFDTVVESAKVGLRKPDPKIYHLACRELQVEPHRAAFLDDIGRNLKAARELGMFTIKVDQPGPALDELARATGIDLS